jgi:hypothetical protein
MEKKFISGPLSLFVSSLAVERPNIDGFCTHPSITLHLSIILRYECGLTCTPHSMEDHYVVLARWRSKCFGHFIAERDACVPCVLQTAKLVSPTNELVNDEEVVCFLVI